MFMTLDPYKCCHDSMKRKFQVKSLAKFAKCDERPEQLSLVKVAKKKSVEVEEHFHENTSILEWCGSWMKPATFGLFREWYVFNTIIYTSWGIRIIAKPH